MSPSILYAIGNCKLSTRCHHGCIDSSPKTIGTMRRFSSPFPRAVCRTFFLKIFFRFSGNRVTVGNVGDTFIGAFAVFDPVIRRMLPELARISRRLLAVVLAQQSGHSGALRRNVRQDFSLKLPVADADPWPEMQRYDFLVRTREVPRRKPSPIRNCCNRAGPMLCLPIAVRA